MRVLNEMQSENLKPRDISLIEKMNELVMENLKMKNQLE